MTYAAKTPEARSLQRHFGQLVTLIQDPTLLAVELYSRGILSHQLLERINNPTLARDFKNIALLSAVISCLEVHPEKFCEVIEVLKGDPTLVSLAARIIETYERDKATLPSSASAITAISEYATYLKLQYESPAIGKWPPSPLNKIINPILIEITEARSNETQELAMSGTTTDVFCLGEILKSRDGLNPKCVLVEGGPGTGKSTLAWGACQGWASGKLFTEYDLVVLLKMREEQLREAKKVSDLFSHDIPTLQNDVAREVTERNGKGVLFLFEALDEFPCSKIPENSVFMKLLKRRTLPEATILITSRPWATKSLREKCGSVISRRLKLCGFTEENVFRYISEAFPIDQERTEFQMYLDKQPHIKTIMNIPLNCAIVVQLYKSYRGTSHVPRTMTQLYSSLVLSLLQRYVKDHPQYESINIQDLAHLPPPISEQFYVVCKLAFTGLTKPSTEVIFTGDELPMNFNSFSLMQTTIRIYPDVGTRVLYHFLHSTVQEFLAALYLSLLNEQVQTHFLLQNAHSSEFEILLAFLFGLTKCSHTLWESLLSDQSGSLTLSNANIQYLHWLYESQNTEACTTFFSAQHVLFPPSELAPFKLYALGYCMFHSNSSWDIDLSMACSGSTAALMLSTALTESNSHATAKEVSFTGSISSLRAVNDTCEDKAFLSLLAAPPRILCGLSALNLQYNNRITSVSCKAVASSLNKGLFPNLESLNFSGSSIGPGGATDLIGALVCSSHVRELNLATTGISLEDVEELGKLLMTSHSLQKLNIANNPLSSASLQLVASVLAKSDSLQDLTLSFISFTTEDVAFLALGLQENCSLEVLHLYHCSIDSTGARHLAETLKENQTLKELYMQFNSITQEGARDFAEMLENNTTLKRLNLTDQSIQITGAIKLLTALESNTTLDLLQLDKSCEPPLLLEHNFFKISPTTIQRCSFYQLTP